MVRWLAVVGAGAWVAVSGVAAAADGSRIEASAAALRQRYEAAQPRMSDSDFGRPVQVASSDEDSRVRGEVLALLDHSMGAVGAALQDPRRWCEILLLTPSISRCEAQAHPARLAVRLARRFDQPPDEGVAAEFALHPRHTGASYTAIALDARKGPLGTRDYRIEVEALALDDRRTVLRIAYSYRYGLRASLAMRAYLATRGGDKVGFTRIDDGDGRVGGLRGSVERNAMRYYLAIEANVAQSSDGHAPAARLEASLDRWLDAIARFPRQLAESDPQAYRRVKRERFTQLLARDDGAG